MSKRVAYLIVKLIERYSCKVVHEVENIFVNISRALHFTTKTHYNVVMGDFKVKVRAQTCSEAAALVSKTGAALPTPPLRSPLISKTRPKI